MFKHVLKVAVSISLLSSTPVFADAIIDAVSNENRPAEQRIRDEYRNPQQTLRFFDVQADMAVAEISPGGGWYSNILAPLLKDKGQYYAAHFYLYDGAPGYYKRLLDGFKQKVATDPNYKNVKVTAFHHIKAQDFAPAGSLDRVLTFRNVHNWYMDAGQEGIEQAFISFAKALKKGGVLGVVDHKLPESATDEMQKRSGYMKQSAVVAAAKKAGLTLVAESDINLNPLDSSDHEKGVWTLPPSLRLGDKDRAKYLAIGESTRMTLKFIKP
ncbi:methyltransferase [uncultured Paraglaciecola sp.]|uniref:class I SAM-dependent methyltransferase n=1 Tax=uncultured Paraglaciecola sp. TaxID=1765024 RepID=UPI0030D86F78|tara:strand:- start:168537 stop:169346 length:810 start_codon:yes stop_codon:yes gene_type:complete